MGCLARLRRATAGTILNIWAIGQKAPTCQKAVARGFGRKSRGSPHVHWPAGKGAKNPWHRRSRAYRKGHWHEAFPNDRRSRASDQRQRKGIRIFLTSKKSPQQSLVRNDPRYFAWDVRRVCGESPPARGFRPWRPQQPSYGLTG